MLGDAIKFIYGSVRANEAAGRLNRMDDYQGLDSTIQLDQNYEEDLRRSRDLYSPMSDQRFEDASMDFASLSYDRTVGADPSFAGVARSAANNQVVRNRNRRAQKGTQLSAQYQSIADNLAREYQRIGLETTTVNNARYRRQAEEAGKAYSDAVEGAVDNAIGLVEPLDSMMAQKSMGGGEDSYDVNEIFDKMPEGMDSDMAFGGMGGGGFGFG